MSTPTGWKRLFRRAYERVSPHQAATLLEEGAILLDVREPYEWQSGHAPAARHIPLSQLTHRIAQLPPGRPIVTVCRSGHRSAQAAALLARQGAQVSNLAGGMHAWARAGLPVVAKGGRPGRIA